MNHLIKSCNDDCQDKYCPCDCHKVFKFNQRQKRSIRELIEAIEETKSSRVLADYAGLLVYEFIKDKTGYIGAWDKAINEEFAKYDKESK